MKNTTKRAIDRLSNILVNAPKVLTQISEEKMAEKPDTSKWSKKEIMGHLIDSATNNHQRLVRGQFETIPEITYDQNNWNKYNCYQYIDSKQIISFWTIYNKQLIEIVKRIPTDNLERQVKIGDNTLTIACLIIDYVAHVEHHLKQVISE